MNLLPRSVATLTLAVSAVPGVAPLAAHVHPQQHAVAHPAAAPTHQGMPGGWMPQNVSSPFVLHAATFAVGDLSQQLGGPYVVETIEHAQSQVVAGTNIQLKLRIARVQDEILGARKECTVTVWSKPSAKAAEKVTSFTCQSVDALPAAPAAAHKAVESVAVKRAIAPLSAVAVVKRAVSAERPAHKAAARCLVAKKVAAHKAAAHRAAAHRAEARKVAAHKAMAHKAAAAKRAA